VPLNPRTIKEHVEDGYRIAYHCKRCGSGWVDLDRLIREGYGDRLVVGAKFRCQKCGKIAETRLHPPAPTIRG
jgi:uncharacterized Zn finger protein